MTVQELINLLQECPNKSLVVVVDGYEGGYHELRAEYIGLRTLQRNVNTEWYYGPHDYPDDANTEGSEIFLSLSKSPSNKPLSEMIRDL